MGPIRMGVRGIADVDICAVGYEVDRTSHKMNAFLYVFLGVRYKLGHDPRPVRLSCVLFASTLSA
ncbi:hypothetical protein N7453_006321 [Penicillium expansum]|nr:hypothetical protein N7453_006321 [Penicillium expansum]